MYLQQIVKKKNSIYIGSFQHHTNLKVNRVRKNKTRNFLVFHQLKKFYTNLLMKRRTSNLCRLVLRTVLSTVM